MAAFCAFFWLLSLPTFLARVKLQEGCTPLDSVFSPLSNPSSLKVRYEVY